MSQPLSDTYSAAFTYWKTVRTQLEHTIQDYVNACTALEAALAIPATKLSFYLREGAIANLDLEIPSVISYEQTLSKCRSSLSLLRNSSYTLNPINNLPSEVLLMILSLASQNWISEDYVTVGSERRAPVPTLSAVCSLWRRLMLQSPTFWTALELVLIGRASNPHYQLAQLWAERSQSVFLDVRVTEGEEVWKPRTDVYSRDISRAVKFLVPLMPRVRKLSIIGYSSAADKVVDNLVACWVQYGTPNAMENLEISLDGELEMLQLPEPDGDSDRFDYFDGLSRCLKYLSLENAFLDRSIFVFPELVELHISFPEEWYPNSSDMAAMLAASPRLRSLTLIEDEYLF